MITELLELLPEEEPPAPEVSEGCSRFLSMARTALSSYMPGLAKTVLSLGARLVSEEHRVGYHLAAGRLWLSSDMPSWHEAYPHFLKAEEGDPQEHQVQVALAELETNLAERFKSFPLMAGFWKCILRRRQNARADRTLRGSWRKLDSVERKSRPLVAVQLIATGRVQGEEVGDIDTARRYLEDAGPECGEVLRRVAHWIRQLHRWQRLQPVTSPWLAVLAGVNTVNHEFQQTEPHRARV